MQMGSENDPEFYCHGQKCIDQGCDPLACKDQPDDPYDPFRMADLSQRSQTDMEKS
jgi:hypothetical protein